jgi:ABC-type nitrate/sulfonate/bicarbonate transport system permease component
MKVFERLAWTLTLPVVLVIVWWFTSYHSHSAFFPPLHTIVGRFGSTWFGSGFRRDLLPSIETLVISFLIAGVAGIALGLVVGLTPVLGRALAPMIEFFRSVPVIALVPAAIVLVGTGMTMNSLLIAFAAAFPVILSTADGVRAVDELQIETATAFGLSKRQTLLGVVLPAASPQIMAGLRIAIGLCVTGMVVVNMISSSQGLGYYIVNAQAEFDVVGTWAGLLVIACVGILANLAFVLVERRVLAWHRGWRGAGDAA